MFSSRKHGSTCPYCSLVVEPAAKSEGRPQARSAEDDDKTMPYLGETEGIEPVTGWLVCIEGPQQGQDYRIMAEKLHRPRRGYAHPHYRRQQNFPQKPRRDRLRSEKRNFYLLPGDASGLAYHNNEAVYTPVELTAYDVIQLGGSTFIFIPLCGVHFEWDNAGKGKE